MKAFSLLLGTALSLVCFSHVTMASAPLLRIDESLKNGVQTIFIQPTTTFQRSVMVLDASVDGSKVELEHPSANLWLYPVSQSAGEQHALSLKISLGNAQKMAQVEASITAVSQEISAVQAAIAAATDPAEIAALTATLGEKQRLKVRLEADRENLKNFTGKQTYFFHANF